VQTAAIGGLTKTSSDSVNRKIPVLGNLPFIGRFFSYEETIDAQLETIIFVTVGLANPEHIDMDTGLPAGTRLAQRHQIQETSDRRIEEEKLNLFHTKKMTEMEEELLKLREANQKLIEKQEAKEKKAAQEEAEGIAKEKAKADAAAAEEALAAEEEAAQEAAAKEAAAAEEEAADLSADLSAVALAKEEELVAPVDDVVLPAVDPVVDLPVVEPVEAPVDPSTNFSSDLPSIVQGIPAEEPSAEKKPSLEKILESLEPATNDFAGGAATTNTTE